MILDRIQEAFDVNGVGDRHDVADLRHKMAVSAPREAYPVSDRGFVGEIVGFAGHAAA